MPVNPERGTYSVLIGGSVGGVTITSGEGTPKAAVVAAVGSLYLRSDGGAVTSLYVKEADGGANTGWVAK